MGNANETIKGNIEVTLYELMGGAEKIRELVDYFYDEMALNESASTIRDMHPKDLSSSRDKLFWFLSGFSGGPDLFVERFGHPRLRARHLPFKIGIKERDMWLACMASALDRMEYSSELRKRLDQQFLQTADWMRNQPEHGDLTAHSFAQFSPRP